MGQLKFTVLQGDVSKDEFDCGEQSINELVYSSYYVTLLQHCYAYKVTLDEAELGYCMMMLRNVKFDLFHEEISEYCDQTFCDRLPVVEIKYIALNKPNQHKKESYGKVMMQGLILWIRKLAEKFPIRVITIDAMDYLVDWYTDMGFKKMPINKQGQDGVTTYMYFDCIKNPDKLAEYINSRL